MLRLLLVLLSVGAVIASCQNPPEYPLEPVIEFMSLDKNTIEQGTGNADTIRVTFSFTDGDGDIGDDENGELNLFLTDLRKDVPADNYRIPKVPPLGANNGIQGEVTFKLLQTCCIFPGGIPTPCSPSTDYPVDTVQYEFYITDRSGKESNRIVTPPILIQCN